MFQETFSPYRPSVLDWRQLAPDALARIAYLPIWDIAAQTEGRAPACAWLRMQPPSASLTCVTRWR
ncbi:hypothetical protein [Caballeronia telluris]|uniref:hypothetical protein n=1 Tax=Caballeronia telluris TaxID=326475 RepID=UPI001F225B0A|nr:hypothetical protein [Caballeronia telluris]